MCAIKINHNGLNIETDTAEEALQVLEAVTKVKKVRKDTTVILPKDFGEIRRFKKHRRMSNPWTEKELNLVWENRDKTAGEVARIAELLLRHNKMAIRRMYKKVKFNRPTLVGEQVARIIASLHAGTPSRFGL